MSAASEHDLIRIVIVGEGLAAATFAAALTLSLPRDRYRVIQVPAHAEDPEDAGWVLPTGPGAIEFHNSLGIDEAALLQSVAGSFTLGTAYAGWSPEAAAWFMPFSEVGVGLSGVPFHRLVTKLRAENVSVNPGDYSLAAMMAQAGRFSHPSSDERSPLSTLAYGLHLPRRAYAKFLIRLASAHGLEQQSRAFRRAEVGNDGDIAAAELEDGTRVAGDFFIDATGATATLVASLQDREFQDWRQWLPCDRLLTLLCSTRVPPSPYSLLSTHAAGWRHSLPAPENIGESFAFASEFMSDHEAQSELATGLLGSVASEARITSLAPGRLREPWIRNVIAVGSAAGSVEPDTGSLHLLQASAIRLLKLIPISQDCSVERQEYNRLTGQELDGARDVAVAKYKLCCRREPFWELVTGMTVPDSLAQKMEMFASRGRVPLFDGDLLDEPEWAMLLDSMGLHPRRIDALAMAIPVNDIQAHLSRLRQALIGAVKATPQHADYVRQFSNRAAA